MPGKGDRVKFERDKNIWNEMLRIKDLNKKQIKLGDLTGDIN